MNAKRLEPRELSWMPALLAPAGQFSLPYKSVATRSQCLNPCLENMYDERIQYCTETMELRTARHLILYLEQAGTALGTSTNKEVHNPYTAAPSHSHRFGLSSTTQEQ